MWGVLQQMVYRDSITIFNNLKEKIRRCWTKLSQGLIDRAVDQWRPRLQAVVKAKEAILNSYLTDFFEYDGYVNVRANLLRADMMSVLFSIVFLNIFSIICLTPNHC